MRFFQAAVLVVCGGPPEWEAQASAISSAETPKASAAPDSIRGMAWIGFNAEREKIGCATSPNAIRKHPFASETAAAPRCTLSTRSPRVISTRTGLAMFTRVASLFQLL